jgi:hypothetical protein
MNSIGSTSPTAGNVFVPPAGGAVRGADGSPATGASLPGAARAMTADAFSGEYAMAVLAKITHASADQALTLIQAMLPSK